MRSIGSLFNIPSSVANKTTLLNIAISLNCNVNIYTAYNIRKLVLTIIYHACLEISRMNIPKDPPQNRDAHKYKPMTESHRATSLTKC